MIFLLFFFLLGVSCFDNKTCIYDRECGLNNYCDDYDHCMPCWACCMLPEKFGSCPYSCQCSESCPLCGQGKYCNFDSYQCLPCYTCSQKENCTSCVNRIGATKRQAFFDFFTYFTIGSESNANNGTVKNVNISRVNTLNWYISQGVSNPNGSVNLLYNNLEYLPYLELAEKLDNLEYNTLCPLNALNALNALPGCPCDPFKDSCPAGYRCSEIDYTGISSMMYDDYLKHSSRYTCIACRQGDYCPIGTNIEETAKGFQSIQCPSGSYCPSPDILLNCTEGSFCGPSLSIPLTCNYSALVRSQVYVEKRHDTVLERLFQYRDAYTGNYCPINSSTPSGSCPSGYYCPNTSSLLICPSGYFCKINSINPMKCPMLTKCPEGSSNPTVYGIPFLFATIVILFIISISIFHKWRTWRTLKINKLDTIIIQKDKGNNDNDKIVDIDSEELLFTNIGINYDEYNRDECKHDECLEGTQIIPLEFLRLIDVSARISLKMDPWLWSNNANFKPRKLNVIIGSSGCGKSTFLDILRGALTNGVLTGRVEAKLKDQDIISLDLTRIENIKQWSSFSKLKKIRGYVPQDDILYGDLTVQENILFSAYLKLCPSKETALEVTKYVLKKLSLESIKNKIVGTVETRGISGGQRKRVNIGMEIVTLPSLLIMDEPTSGLDANGCQMFVDFCKCLTNMNITIVSVIHQPRYSSFALFDHIILLSKYGTVFEGSSALSLLYLSNGLGYHIDKNENPADVLMDIISGNKSYTQQQLVNLWRSNDNDVINGGVSRRIIKRVNNSVDGQVDKQGQISRRINGKEWVSQCKVQYPLISQIVNKEITFDQNTQIILNQMLDDELSCESVVAFFSKIYIPIDEVTATFLAGNKKQFIKKFHEICSSAYLTGTYSNIIDRLSLFINTPKGIFHKYTETQLARHVLLAYMFGKRLMRKIGLSSSEIDTNGNNNNGNDNSKINNKIITYRNPFTSVLLASMTLKAIKEYMDTKNELFYIHVKRKPNILYNLLFIIYRKLIMIWRSPWHLQILIPIFAAFIIGNIQSANFKIQNFPSNIVFSVVCMAVLSMITHVRTFSLDKVIIRREIDNRLNIFPFFIAYNIVDFIWIALIPLVYMIPYYYYVLPRTPFYEFYGVSFMVCWWGSGISYIVSAFPIAIQWANLIVVFVAVIFGAFLQGLNPTISDSIGTFQGAVINVSYNRWAMEILTLKEYSFYDKLQPNIVWSIIDNIGLCGTYNEIKGIMNDITNDINNNTTGSNNSTSNSTDNDYNNIYNIYQKISIPIDDQCQEYIRNAYLWLFGFGLIFRLISLGLMCFYTNPIFLRLQWKIKNLLL